MKALRVPRLPRGAGRERRVGGALLQSGPHDAEPALPLRRGALRAAEAEDAASFPESATQGIETWIRLDPHEVAQVLEHVCIELRPLFTFVANTGLRIGTALGTQRRWIDWDRRHVNYPASAMKHRRRHTTELNAPAERALRVALANSPEEPFPQTYWYIYKRWAEARVAAGWPTLRIHDLRHSFISNQLEAGTPINVVRDLAGTAASRRRSSTRTAPTRPGRPP
ncbi:MAG: tyrosine-type recombinase/integrase [Sandaracinaceae bacterium]